MSLQDWGSPCPGPDSPSTGLQVCCAAHRGALPCSAAPGRAKGDTPGEAPESRGTPTSDPTGEKGVGKGRKKQGEREKEKDLVEERRKKLNKVCDFGKTWAGLLSSVWD